MAIGIILNKHILEEFILHNETAEHKSVPFQLKPEIRFQVFPKKEKQPIATEMSIELGNMDDGSPLYIKLRMRGLFITVGGEADQQPNPKDFHKQAFVQLFNCARTLIAGATLMGGMPPFNLPPINPENLNMQKTDNGEGA